MSISSKVKDPIVRFGDLAKVLREDSYYVRFRSNVTDSPDTSGSGSAGSDSQWCTRVVVENASQLPFIDDLLDPAWRVTQQEVPCSERQLVDAVAGELVHAIAGLQLLFNIATVRINEIHRGAHRLTPRPCCGVREAGREPPGELQLQRMIGGVAEIVQHRDPRELRVDSDVVFGKAVFAQDADGLAPVHIGQADVHDHEVDVPVARGLHALCA